MEILQNIAVIANGIKTKTVMKKYDEYIVAVEAGNLYDSRMGGHSYSMWTTDCLHNTDCRFIKEKKQSVIKHI